MGRPRTPELDLDGLAVAMVHDSGQAQGRAARMRRWFPHADLVVFGHSHIPLDETADGVRIFNPGSPTDRRRQPHGTMGVLTSTRGAHRGQDRPRDLSGSWATARVCRKSNHSDTIWQA